MFCLKSAASEEIGFGAIPILSKATTPNFVAPEPFRGMKSAAVEGFLNAGMPEEQRGKKLKHSNLGIEQDLLENIGHRSLDPSRNIQYIN